MKSAIQYTQSVLNRSDDLRRSPEAIDALWHDPACRVAPVYQSKHLFDSNFNPVFAPQSLLQTGVLGYSERTFLGLKDKVPYFSCLCTEIQAQDWCEYYRDTSFIDLRSAGAALSGDIASILAYARGVSHWQVNNRFCARCGGENKLKAAGHMMQCQECEAQVFPRTDPAVIMLVEHIDDKGTAKCLLGRSPAWPQGCYSTLAGFVETGESLETAVIREVFEETGIVVTNPAYVTSQPWPFPQSVMLGFVARADNLDLVIDEHELADAAWFSPAEIRTFGEWADNSTGYKLPRVDSIARYLINRWLEENPVG